MIIIFHITSLARDPPADRWML